LGEVEELRTKEAALKAEEQRHLDLIAASEGEVRGCDDELVVRIKRLRPSTLGQAVENTHDAGDSSV
jgi:hypothetical protein